MEVDILVRYYRGLKMNRSLTDITGQLYPILQGGMTFGSDGRLVAAVCEAGGLGTLGTFHYRDFEQIAEQLELIRDTTDRPYSVNVPFFENNIELIRRSVDAGVKIFTLGGWCSDEVARLKEAHDLTILVSVNSPTIARFLEDQPIDLIIAQGNESGGANGSFTARQLLDYLIENSKHPVALAGGLWDGFDLHGALLLGAVGIQLGTRFFFAEESPLHPSIKERVVTQARRKPTTTQLVPVTETLNMRFIINKPLKVGLRQGSVSETFQDKQKVYDLSAAFFEEQHKSVLIYAGAGVHKLRTVQNCAGIIRELIDDYNALVSDGTLERL